MSFGPVIGAGGYVIIKEEPVQANEVIYNGKLQSVTWNYDKNKMIIVDDPGNQKNADTYRVGFKPIKQYCWSNGNQKVKYFEWILKPKEIAAPVLTVSTREYNGTFQSPDIKYDPAIEECGDQLSDIFIIEHGSERDADDYTISWTLKSSNYKWIVAEPAVKTASWSITTRKVSVPTVSDITKTYDTKQQHPTVVPSSSSDWTIVDGYSKTDAGNYNLVISLNDKQNTSWSTTNKNDDLTFSWTINKRQITKPTWTGTTFTYKGSSQGPTVSNVPSSTYVTTSGEVTAVNAGTHTIRYILSKNTSTVTNTVWAGDNSTNDVIITYDINVLKIPIPSSSSSSHVYDTLSHTPGLTDMKSYYSYLDITGTSEATNVGNYEVVYTIKSSVNSTVTNVTWNDGKTETKKISWAITVRTINKPYLSSSSFVFAAKNFAVTDYEKNFSSTYMTRSGNLTGFDVDDYTTVYTLKCNTATVTNTVWAGGSTNNVELSWKITKKSLTIPKQSGTLTYDTKEQTASWDKNYDTNFMTVSGNKGTNAKSYVATFTSKYPGNAQFGTSNTATVTWSIGVRTITKPTLTGPPYTYNGSSYSPTRNNENMTYMTRSGDISGTDAKTYTITYTLSKNTSGVTNTKWEGTNSTSPLPLTWTINKAAASKPKLSKSSIAVTKSSPTATFTVTRDGNGIISVQSSDTAYVTATISGTTVTVKGLKDTTSAITLTVTVGEGSNYKATTSSTKATISVTVSGYIVRLSVKSTDIVFIGKLTYTGEKRTAEGSMFSNYDPSTMNIANNTGTAISNYTATITCKDGYKFYDDVTVVQVPWSIVEQAFKVIDEVGKSIINIGSCTDSNLSTKVKRFGTASFYCDGNEAHQVKITNLSSLFSAASDWTIEFWVMGGPDFNAQSTSPIIDVGGLLSYSPAQYVVKGYFTASGVFVSNEGWTHFALCHKVNSNGSHSTTTFSNGNSGVGVGYTAAPSFSHNELIINSAGCSAYIDEIRISNICRWTSSFAFPTAPYTVDKNTVLLLHFDK